jgi:hypothetical protein
MLAAGLFLAAWVAAGQVLPLGKPLPGMGPAAAPEVTLRNPGFETPTRAGASCPTGWECIMHAASDSFRFFLDDAHPAAGTHSGCFESVGRQPWGKMVQGHPAGASVRGKHVRLSALVRLKDVTGEGAGPILMAHGGSGNELAHRFAPTAAGTGWHRVSAELDVPQDTYILELGFALQGKGQVCVDEVRFEVLAAT